MGFQLKGKVALVTGGASGIGLRYAKELLRNGVKGLTLADVDAKFGASALEEIEKEFGTNKAIFVKTDVSDITQFENAFKKTIETFKYVDILINNAGILNDYVWEKEVAINVNGVIHGMLLGMENYLQKYRQDSEAVIVNISSIAGIGPFGFIPIYCGTKSAVAAMTRAWGQPEHYERTKVRVFAICPGVTNTSLLFDAAGRNLGEHYENMLTSLLDILQRQPPEYVATEAMKLIQRSENGALWVIEGGQQAYQFTVPERNTMIQTK